MFVPCLRDYLRLTAELFESGDSSSPVPVSYRAWQLPDRLKAEITVGRAEGLLASARAQMGLKYRTLACPPSFPSTPTSRATVVT